MCLLYMWIDFKHLAAAALSSRLGSQNQSFHIYYPTLSGSSGTIFPTVYWFSSVMVLTALKIQYTVWRLIAHCHCHLLWCDAVVWCSRSTEQLLSGIDSFTAKWKNSIICELGKGHEYMWWGSYVLFQHPLWKWHYPFFIRKIFFQKLTCVYQ